MTLMEEIAALQDRLAAAQRARVLAEGARDQAQAAAEHAAAELKRDFGVETTTQAETLLAEMHAELARITDALKAKLDEIGV